MAVRKAGHRSGSSVRETDMSQGNPTSVRPQGWPTRTLLWSCLGSLALGALLVYGAGFHWVGQWQTGEQVQHRLAVAACVRDFLLQPDRGVMYAQLKATASSYQRRQLLRERKLADNFAIAEQCGDEIRSFDASGFPPPAEAKADVHNPA